MKREKEKKEKEKGIQAFQLHYTADYAQSIWFILLNIGRTPVARINDSPSNNKSNNKHSAIGLTNHVTLLNKRELERIGDFFQVAMHFPPSHPRPNIINTSFFALVGLALKGI